MYSEEERSKLNKLRLELRHADEAMQALATLPEGSQGRAAGAAIQIDMDLIVDEIQKISNEPRDTTARQWPRVFSCDYPRNAARETFHLSRRGAINSVTIKGVLPDDIEVHCYIPKLEPGFDGRAGGPKEFKEAILNLLNNHNNIEWFEQSWLEDADGNQI